MKLANDKQVFNLMNTNGRRADVINAYTIYIEILNEIIEENGEVNFTPYPYSWNQFRFYKEAIERSPEVFKSHPQYDKFIKILQEHKYHIDFQSRDIEPIERLSCEIDLLKILDEAIEMRARHYTSNLNKIGFTKSNREITSVGKSYVQGSNIGRDKFEQLLPIDDTNLIFLRQLLKLRIYSSTSNAYYSPMMMCLYILLSVETISVKDLLITCQLLSPDYVVSPETFLKEVVTHGVVYAENNYIFYDDNDEYIKVAEEDLPMSKKIFESIFKNRKSNNSPSYYKFYISWINFMKDKSESNLKNLYSVWKDNKDRLNKAFYFGQNIFEFDRYNPTDVDLFLERNKGNPYLDENMQIEEYNGFIYDIFNRSKRHDQVSENSDTLLRLLTVTGIISTKNGVARLEYKDIWELFFKDIDIEDLIFVQTSVNEYEKYEKNEESDFYNHRKIKDIFNLTEVDVDKIINNIKVYLSAETLQEIKEKLNNQVENKFEEFIKENYSRESVYELLNLFSDRSNDKIIQEKTNSNASVPTIFEYVVGLAWYYISDDKYDVFSSFNLTMNADFAPETHAGGGAGDIVAEYPDRIVMLEATLMNKQAQKRGEWEPVLRHATNLTIEQEPTSVFTFFIADELDENTINIWRAIASVPLKSSQQIAYPDEYAERVTIMPFKNSEYGEILKRSIGSNVLIKEVKESYSQLTTTFDLKWREDILEKISLK